MAEGWLTYGDFADRIGQRFDLRVEDEQSFPLTLAEATQLGRAGGRGPDGSSREQFSLVFLGPAEPALPQATWPLVHEELGDLLLFLVPLGPAAGGMQYEAVFG